MRISTNRTNLIKLTRVCTLMLVTFFLACNDGKQKDRAGAGEETIAEIARDSAYVVEVAAADFAFGMPTEVPSGWVTFRMKNLGQEVHNAVIQKYADTLTYKGLAGLVSAAIAEEDTYLPEAEKSMGGPAMLSPGLTGETTVFLEPGIYGMFCFMVAKDGTVHFQKGMARPFVVKDEKSGADEPKGTVDITVSELAIDIEDPIKAGDHVFNVNFQTSQNVHLAKLSEGQDLEDLKEWMVKAKNPSPFIFLGGAEEAEVGMNSTFKATLEPGRYALATYYWARSGMAEEIVIPENGAADPVKNQPINPPVSIRITPQGSEMPDEVETGRTLITFETAGDKQGFYILSRVKEGNSLPELKQFWEEVYLHNRTDLSEEVRPDITVWYGTVTSQKEKTFNLEIQKGTYVFMGPIPPEDQMAEQWKGDEMFHAFRGEETQSVQ